MAKAQTRYEKLAKDVDAFTIPNQGGWDRYTKDLATAVCHVLQRIKDTVRPQDWNRLYAELWLDSGRFLFYPHKRGKPRSTRPFTTQVESLFLLTQFDNLPEPEDADQFEIDSAALEGRVLISLNTALRARPTKALLKSLRQTCDFTIWYQDGADEDSLVPFD